MLLDYDHWYDVSRPDWRDKWPNFTPEEIACRESGEILTTWDFMNQLQDLRDSFGKPMHVTSACRSPEHNTRIKGATNSYHLTESLIRPGGSRGCMAVDIAAVGGWYRGELLWTAWGRGWSVGWNAERGFLHLDRRVDAGQNQTTFSY